MKELFFYNWQVRDEWLQWCRQVTESELLKRRTGGPGGILFTLFHIAEVEYSWVQAVKGEKDQLFSFHQFGSLEKVSDFSRKTREEISPFIAGLESEQMNRMIKTEWEPDSCTVGDILRHVIVHEIHHVGQLSVWAREIGLEPVQVNVVGRNLTDLLPTGRDSGWG